MIEALGYWRFRESMSVIQAALLIAGADPADFHYAATEVEIAFVKPTGSSRSQASSWMINFISAPSRSA